MDGADGKYELSLASDIKHYLSARNGTSCLGRFTQCPLLKTHFSYCSKLAAGKGWMESVHSAAKKKAE